ncbi:MAG TPA: hypothetical protein VM096_11160 [Vicinamibacterales bacterium]|nr:hypothetical protein [Vicinamibacterales bacterium]
MIANRDRTTVLSSLVGVDGDAIWVFDVESGQARTIPQNTGARHTTLHASDSERFIAVHHFDGARFMASVNLFSAPEVTVSTASYENGRTSLHGNSSAWQGLPQLFVTYLAHTWNDHVLVKIVSGHIHIQRLEWYDSSYDKGRQGVCDVIALPDPRYALISVQRSSELVVHDLETGKATRRVSLRCQLESPKLALRESGTEVWASDDDNVVVLDTDSWRVKRKRRLRSPEALELRNGEVIARDSKTGDLRRGKPEPASWLTRLFAKFL